MQIKLTFTGDLMCDSNAIKEVEQDFFDKKIIKFFKDSDYVITNLETPICDHHAPSQKYVFSAPIEFAQKLKQSGIDCATTANNHCLDRGISGLKETLDNLDKIGIDHFGTYKTKNDSKKIFIKQFDNLKIAFLSYTYGTNAFLNHVYLNDSNSHLVNLLKKQEFKNKILRKIKDRFFENIYFYNPLRDRKYLQKIKKEIQNAKKQSDFVVFCLHSGGQYNQKIDHYTKKICDFLVDNGVDIVIGNHPHIIQEHKIINNKHIFYSLGNFFATPFSNHNQKDDFPDHSILLNLYLDTQKKTLTKIDYHILKTTIENGVPKTYYLSDLNEKNSTTIEHIKNLIEPKGVE